MLYLFCSPKNKGLSYAKLQLCGHHLVLVFARISPNHQLFTSWSELLSWARESSRQGPSLLRKLIVHTLVFHTWKQRNNVLYNNQSIPPLSIFTIIDRDVKNIINSRRHRKRWKDLMHFWIR